jgi:hypothetical protein
MRTSLGLALFAGALLLPALVLARDSFESPYLSCSSVYPVVSQGSAGRFEAVTNMEGPFMWVVGDTGYIDMGPTLVVPMTEPGNQQVTVVKGTRRASCFVDVVPAGGFGEPYGYSFYPGNELNVTLTAVAYPSLPNAGFSPQNAAAFAVSFVFLLGSATALYPHVRKVFIL